MSNTKLTQEQFIKRCIDAHGKNYDYSKIIYVNSTTKVLIICNTCSHEWFIIPGNFTSHRQGCPECKNKRHRKRMIDTIIAQDKFLDRCKLIHNEKYDYSLAKYTGSGNKISIICPNHGNFSQIAYDHSIGIGCKQCGIEKLLETKISKGMIRDPKDIPEYENYCNKVWYTTERNFLRYNNIINPTNLKRGYEYNLDHVFSIQEGFNNKIDAKIIGHYTNLRLIPALDNRIKHSKCDKTFEQLINDFSNSTQ